MSELGRPDGVQRVWRLVRPREDCIGAIVSGYVPDVTTPDTEGHFVALVSFARSGEPQRREHADGRVFYVSQWEGDNQTRGTVSETLDQALADLDRIKQQLLAEGWIESSLDPVDDPD